MICDDCKGKDDCKWYTSYKNIEREIYLGLDPYDVLGKALLEAMDDNQLVQCKDFKD